MSIKVVCGANTHEGEFVGMTVGEVRQQLKDVLNIADEAQTSVSGDVVKDDYVLKEGDNLEFIKKAGDKGQ